MRCCVQYRPSPLMGEGKGIARHIGARRAAGLLCMAILHIGAWYVVSRSASTHNRVGPPAAKSANVIMLKIIPASARHADAGESITVTPVIKPRRRNEWRPAIPQPDDAPLEEATRTLPATQDETVAPASAVVLPDSATVKHVIADFVAEERGKGIRSTSTLTSHSSAAEKAIGAAFRPRCNSDDVAKVGSVRLTGLLKLPALIRGAVSDEGCKW